MPERIPVEIAARTDAGGFFAVPHGHGGRPTSLVPDMRDEHVAMEFTGFDETDARGILRSRETGEPVPSAEFTARFLVVT